MPDPSALALDVRVEVERAVAPLLDLMREQNALLRTVLEEVQELHAER